MDDLIFTTTNNFLHHGIDGQKWGVRNGPPYPLDNKNSNSAQTKNIKKEEKIKRKKEKEEYKALKKEKYKDYKNAYHNTQKKLYDAYKNYNTITRLKNPELYNESLIKMDIAFSLIKETRNEYLDYMKIRKGEKWLNKHKNDYFSINYANMQFWYDPTKDHFDIIEIY